MVNVLSDWSDYRYLILSFHNPTTRKIQLTIKITDREHDLKFYAYNNRFNAIHNIYPGENEIVIKTDDIAQMPQNRQLDLANMSKIGFFVMNIPLDTPLYVKEIRLEK